MNLVLTVLMLVATGAVAMRCLSLVSILSHKKWVGHTVEFIGFSVAIALTVGGAFGILLGSNFGATLMLIGVAGWMIFDRRF